MPEEVRKISFVGDGDVTVWLENANSAAPLIFPLWPKDFPVHAPIRASVDGELVVALSRKAMLAARAPDYLWFCHISLEDLLANTDADASWFSGG